MWNWIKRLFSSVDFSKVDDVLKKSAEVCGYLPTIQTVLNILAIGNPALSTASGIATAICSALHGPRPQTLTGERSKPEIEGVTIEGSFIK